ncbi:hypothetical protein ACEPAF_1997 [Sanghuangporus sanghuang]
MWLVEGAFDQTGTTNLEQKKLKLLKPGKTYPLGRKQKRPLQLVLGHPKISSEHLTFVVGEHSVDSVNDPTFRPTLRVQNHRTKALQVSRNINGAVTRHMIQPASEDEVLPGDCVALVAGIYINIHWRPVCCFLPPKSPSVSFERCASLGVKVVSTPRPEVTHHLTGTLSVSTSIAISLLNLAHIVRPDWLTELLHLSETTTSPDAPSVLEFDFRLPIVSQHVPKVDSDLPASLKSLSLWEPNERRAGMLKGWRFLFVGEKGREVGSETRTLVERGGGEYEVFDVSGGLTRWKQSLSRNRRKSDAEGGRNLSVIGDTEILKIASGEAWNGMLEELRNAELCFVSLSQLLSAVVSLDTSRISSTVVVSTEIDSSLPDRVPNTYEDRPSSVQSQSNEMPKNDDGIAQEGNASSSRSVESPAHEYTENARHDEQQEQQARGTSVEQQAELESEGLSAPTTRRRPLVRRARTNATQAQLLGVDDPSLSSFSQSVPLVADAQNDRGTSVPPEESQAAEKPPSSQATTTGRSSRLKKRARADKDYNPILASLEEEIAAATTPAAAQPPLKRFKALFDETDPDRVASQMTNGGSGGILDSQMFSQASGENGDQQNDANEPSHPPLVAIPEEEEGSQSLPVDSTANRENAEMDIDSVAPQTQPHVRPPPKANGPTSQVQTQAFDSTQVHKRTGSRVGAAPGQHDTDAAFLQALASTKKGKRREDDFDREFNNLRISKPEQESDAQADDWKVLADFGDDSNIRGNFMVIVEMEVPEKRTESSREASVAPSKGPDFKKFRKKTNARERPPVELVANVENDYGMGPAYWKGSQSQHQSQGASQSDSSSFPQQSLLQPSQAQNRAFLQPKAGPSSQMSKPRSQNQTQTQSKAVKTKTQEVPRRTRSRPLQIIDDDDEESEELQPHAIRKTRAAANGKKANGKRQQLFLSDDDEDEIRSAEKESHGDEEFDLDLLDADMSDEEPAPPTLRSTAQSTADVEKPKAPASPTKRGAKTKKRAAALLEDDSDSGVAFKGFRGRKKMRAK